VGSYLWHVILGEHVYTRFTASVDPSHIQPWNFYFVEAIAQLHRDQTYWLVVAGGLLLLFRAIKDRGLTEFVVVSWFAVPLALMSLGTSKLHHYLYPFLPPLALAAGYGPAWLVATFKPWVERALEVVSDRSSRVRAHAALNRALAMVGFAALAASAWTLAFGPIRVRLSGITLFRNSDVVRPLLVAIVLMVLTGRPKLAAQIAAIALVVTLMPLQAYRRTTALLTQYDHPLRSARDCISSVNAASEAAGRPVLPLYAIAENKWFLHSYYYYLHHVGWQRAERVDDVALAAALTSTPRPVLVTDADYRAFKSREQLEGAPSVVMQRLQHALLLLPGPYAVCGQELSSPNRTR
jgi:hypothetical protein